MSRPPYKLFSLLLQYPDDDLLRARTDIEAAIAALPRSAAKTALHMFFEHFGAQPGMQLQERYVETFDLQRRSSLYLTFYTEGDTRKRGQALLRLKRLYSSAGLEIDSRELPDFLPLMLEFAALAPEGIGHRLLSEHRAGLELLRLHLREVDSPYRHLLDGICSGLPRMRAPESAFVTTLLRDGPPDELVGLQFHGAPR